MGSRLTVCVGIGINLKNEKPFKGVNLLSGKDVKREELVAKIFNNLGRSY